MSEKVIEALTVRELFRSPEHTMAWEYLKGFTYPWEALDGLKAFVVKLGETLPTETYERREGDVWIAKSAKVYPTATILGPAIIGERTEVRPGAFIRGSVLVGEYGCYQKSALTPRIWAAARFPPTSRAIKRP